jgi:hypothetical protein
MRVCNRISKNLVCAGDVHSPVQTIHPRRKQEVGRRLALSALSVQYVQPVVSTGPVFAFVNVTNTSAANTTATVSFAPGTASGLRAWRRVPNRHTAAPAAQRLSLAECACRAGRHGSDGRLWAGGLAPMLRGEPVRGAKFVWAVGARRGLHAAGWSGRAAVACGGIAPRGSALCMGGVAAVLRLQWQGRPRRPRGHCRHPVVLERHRAVPVLSSRA